MQKVLVVEDEKALRRVLRELLDTLDFAVIEAEDGIAALECLQAQDDLPNIIMTDLNMPRMGGLELTRQIKAHPQWQHIPIIVVSGSANDEQRILGAGANRFLLKPFTLSSLEEAFADL